MKIIPVKIRHKLASIPSFVDDESFEILSKFKWHQGKNWYPLTHIWISKGKRPTYAMHQLVIGKALNGKQIDHINRNVYDNRRQNLRIVSPRKNQWNREPPLSGLTGVFKTGTGYISKIRIGSVQKYLGFFKDKQEAAIVYKKAVEIYEK